MAFPRYLPEVFFTNPVGAKWATDKVGLDSILRATKGELESCGQIWIIIYEDTGSGIFRITLKAKECN